MTGTTRIEPASRIQSHEKCGRLKARDLRVFRCRYAFATILLVACGAPKPSCPTPGGRNVPLVGATFDHDGNGQRPLGSDPASAWLAQCRARPDATRASLDSLAGIRSGWDCPAETPPIDFSRSRIEVLLFRTGDGIQSITETDEAVVIDSSSSAWCQGTAPPREQPWYFVVPRKPLRSCSSKPADTCSGGPRP